MSHFHAVRFYETTESICGTVAVFLGGGFIRKEPALVIATPPHRLAIAEALRSVNSASADALEAAGALVMIDAGATLGAFMVNDTPDPVRFESVAGGAIESLAGPPEGAVRIYDEMVDVLWKREEADAAMRLETLWDRLAVNRHCSLLCGHAVGRLCLPDGRQTLCSQHSHVLAGNGVPHPLKSN